MNLKFCSLASGSSGNCYYVGNDKQGILIDAGIGVKTIKKRLKAIDVSLESILGIFVTHDHYDHISSVGVLGEVYNIPIYSTQEILDGINKCYKVTDKLYHSKHPIEKGNTTTIGDFLVESFPVSHDSTDCVGYSISYKKTLFTIATDLGYINSEAAIHIVNSTSFVIESNYDEEILLQGPYPLFLKERILSKKGHLSNHEMARFLSENYQEHWKNIFLCHLSKENNTPEAAIQAVKTKLEENNIEVNLHCQLMALPRTSPTCLFEL